MALRMTQPLRMCASRLTTRGAVRARLDAIRERKAAIQLVRACLRVVRTYVGGWARVWLVWDGDCVGVAGCSVR